MQYLAHLSRRRRRRDGELRAAPLFFAGWKAGGDEYRSPTSVVIDVGRSFVITDEGNLYLTGPGKAQFKEFTPCGLLDAAKAGWFDFTLLWDESDEPIEKDATVDES